MTYSSLIGTRSRLIARSQDRGDGSKRPILGEKGLGRLSAMRLGTKLRVESTTAQDSRWNRLDIDWSIFSHDSDAMLDAFHIAPQLGRVKKRRNYSGTRIRVSGPSISLDQRQVGRTRYSRVH